MAKMVVLFSDTVTVGGTTVSLEVAKFDYCDMENRRAATLDVRGPTNEISFCEGLFGEMWHGLHNGSVAQLNRIAAAHRVGVYTDAVVSVHDEASLITFAMGAAGRLRISTLAGIAVVFSCDVSAAVLDLLSRSFPH